MRGLSITKKISRHVMSINNIIARTLVKLLQKCKPVHLLLTPGREIILQIVKGELWQIKSAHHLQCCVEQYYA